MLLGRPAGHLLSNLYILCGMIPLYLVEEFQ